MRMIDSNTIERKECASPRTWLFRRRDAIQACQPTILPDIKVSIEAEMIRRRLLNADDQTEGSLHEDPVQSRPAKLNVKLSVLPSSDVKITLTVDNQLNISSGEAIISAGELQAGTIFVSARNDDIHEGGHFGIISFSVSSSDVRYHAMRISPASFGILDDDCPHVESSPFASMKDCSNSFGQTCTITCDIGHAPGSPQTLTCNKTTADWDGVPPSCDTCLPDYFMAGRRCQSCSTLSCPTGHYRDECQVARDSICVRCTNFLPAHAFYVGPGVPRGFKRAYCVSLVSV